MINIYYFLNIFVCIVSLKYSNSEKVITFSKQLNCIQIAFSSKHLNNNSKFDFYPVIALYNIYIYIYPWPNFKHRFRPDCSRHFSRTISSVEIWIHNKYISQPATSLIHVNDSRPRITCVLLEKVINIHSPKKLCDFQHDLFMKAHAAVNYQRARIHACV